jgi:hypothetical protein
VLCSSVFFTACGGSRSSVSAPINDFEGFGGDGDGDGDGDGGPGLFPPVLFSGAETNQRYYTPFETDSLDTLGVDALLRVKIQAQRLVDVDFPDDPEDNRFQTQDYHKIQYRVFVLYDGLSEEQSFSADTVLLDATSGQSQIIDLSEGLRPGMSNLRIKVIPLNDNYMCRSYGGSFELYCPSWKFWKYNIYNFNMEVEWDLSYSL